MATAWTGRPATDIAAAVRAGEATAGAVVELRRPWPRVAPGHDVGSGELAARS